MAGGPKLNLIIPLAIKCIQSSSFFIQYSIESRFCAFWRDVMFQWKVILSVKQIDNCLRGFRLCVFLFICLSIDFVQTIIPFSIERIYEFKNNLVRCLYVPEVHKVRVATNCVIFRCLLLDLIMLVFYPIVYLLIHFWIIALLVSLLSYQ